MTQHFNHFIPKRCLLFLRILKMTDLYQNLANLASSVRNDIPCEALNAQSFSGSFHFVFLLRFNDGIEWIARVSSKALSLQHSLLKEDIDRFASEISTLRWLRDNTSVKVPQLYAWNIPDAGNLTESEATCKPQTSSLDTLPWMLMERLHGVSLTYEMWDSFGDEQRQKVIMP